MAENNPYLKSVNELLQYNFFIPAYQRGYRWTEQEVGDLLKDINEFIPKEVEGSDNKTWYCLQPLVIKKCDKEIIEKFHIEVGKDWYEVIDGQQRITTIFLIVHYINEMWRGRQKFNEIQLKYETRDKSEEFLKHLKIDEFDKINVNKENIDFFHISVAYQTIHSWFQSQKNFDTSNFESKFIHSVKVIWYETLAVDSINIFTRINMGKIPLTNSELIKALFLNSSNFKNSDPDKVLLIQLEIASEWDRIEYALQDESFWYFLNKETNFLTPRIEFIFDLIAEKPIKRDDYFTFRYFSKKFINKTEKEIIDNWQEIKVYYQTLEEWFINRELYHKIGFLVATGTEIKTLISLKKNKSKIEFKESLNDLIKGKVSVQLSELEYQKGPVKNVLLLYNIQTMLNNINETNRFPFDRYKKEKWDVEHISAVAEEMPQTEKHQKDWLMEVSKFISNSELKSKAENYNKDQFQEVYNQILKHFDEEEKVENENEISNLALLDVKTNRGYGNAVFPVKRDKIIQKDKAGIFIPICTKNVFMKLYNDDVDQMTFWGEKDRKVYVKDIADTLEKFLPQQINIGNE